MQCDLPHLWHCLFDRMLPMWFTIHRPNQQPPTHPVPAARSRCENQRQQKTHGIALQLPRPHREKRQGHGRRPINLSECGPPIGGRLDHVLRHAPTSGLESTLLTTTTKMAEISDTDALAEVTCPACEQIFATEKAERRHYTLEHNKVQLLHSCEWCEKRYASSSALKRHHAARHSDRTVKRWNWRLEPNDRRLRLIVLPRVRWGRLDHPK